MYLYIGQNELIPEERILGVFDLDMCGYGKRTQEFFRRAEEAGVVLDSAAATDGAGDPPRSFLLCSHPYHEQVVYLSRISARVLARQTGFPQNRVEHGENSVK